MAHAIWVAIVHFRVDYYPHDVGFRTHSGEPPKVAGPLHQKLVAFYVQEHNSRLPHSAFRGQTPDEMYFKTGDSIPEELELARQEARLARAEANRKRTCSACVPPAASLN